MGMNDMKWKRKYRLINVWYRWFAWYPVKVERTTVDTRRNERMAEITVVWLQWVERKFEHIYPGDYRVTYREIGSGDKENEEENTGDKT